MSKNLKRMGFLFLLFLCLFIAARLYYRLTDDFRLTNISYQLPFKAHWEVSSVNREEYQKLEKILDQKFSYIGKGAQCYAFVSDDGQYVIKFFKFKHLKPNAFIEYLPAIPPWKRYKESCVERKKRKLISVFNGYDLAFRENRQGAKLVYLHLLPTNDLNLKAVLVDKIGIKRIIDLDDVVFLIQEKGETLRSRLRHLLDEHRLIEAKQAVASILAMYISEYERGIYDHDHGVLQNTGFVGQQPFHLDVGKLNQDKRMKEIEFYKKDFEHVIWKIDTWIKLNYPDDYPAFSIFLSEQYQTWIGEILNIHTIDPKLYKKRRKLFGL